MKPSVFIGSSSEALSTANAIADELKKSFDTFVWKDRLFALGEDTLDGLLRFVQCYDFAVLVISADDLSMSRGMIHDAPRDNVIFELGLFTGALGRRRTFPIVVNTATASPKLPSDLLGNTALGLPFPIPTGHALEAELQPLVEAITQRATESYLQLLPSTALAIGYFQNFVLPVCQELARQNEITLGGKVIDISEDNYDFTIVLPKTLSDASTHGASRFTKAIGAGPFELKCGSRPYPFYVRSDLHEGRVVFYDYPTTLNASQKAIRLALHKSSLGDSRDERLLEKKEIANFQRTIETLLKEPEAAEFRDNVKFMQAP